MSLTPLYDLTQQFNNKNGAVLVGGRLYVYYVGRTELATTWADEDAAAQNTNPVLLDNNGRAPVFVDDSYSYTLVVCDRAGTELFSQDITPGGAGSVGGRIVYHDETLSGAGTVSSLLSVVNIPLGVDETMTAYTGVSEGKDALILGVNGDWFNKTFSGEFDQKVDLETFSACCSSVKEGLDNKLDASAINNYYTKNEVDERTSSFVNYNFLSSNYYNKFETSALFQDKLTFDYNENSDISAINGSALACQGGYGGDCPWISGSKVIGDTTITLTDNTIFQVLSSFDFSGDHNHCIGVKGSNFRFPNRWEIASGIAETNYFMPHSGMSSYLPISSFSSYTASVASNLETNWNYTNSAYSLSINNFNNKLDSSAFTAWSATYSGNSEVNNYVINNSSLIDESVNVVQTNSAQWEENTGDTEVNNFVYNNSGINNEVNNLVTANSGYWNTVTGKLDYSAFTAYTANDENYTLIGGKDIGISSDDNEKTTTIYFTGSNGDTEVNQVVRNYSANGTWLTAHQDLSNYATTSQIEQISAAVSSIPKLSGGEGVHLVNEDNITRVDLGLSAGSNMSFVYDQESNTIRMDCEATDGNSAVNNYVETHSAIINRMNNDSYDWNEVVNIIRTYSAQWLLANP